MENLCYGGLHKLLVIKGCSVTSSDILINKYTCVLRKICVFPLFIQDEKCCNFKTVGKEMLCMGSPVLLLTGYQWD